VTLSPRFRLPLLVFVGALVAHGVLLAEFPLLWRTVAVLVLAGLLPGLLIVELLVGRSSAPPEPGEFLLYAVGVGYAVLIVGFLLLSYLPGPLSPWLAYTAFDTLILLLLLLTVSSPQYRRTAVRLYHPLTPLPPLPAPHLSPLLALTLLFLIGGYLRFANLGYAEYHGDEGRAILRAAAVIQGYEEVLFLHKKGPTEILLPAAIFAFAGQVSEAAARLPLALANLAALGAVFLLGWRLLGPFAGWVAVLLLALDGYLIAFSRFVQYQSVVLLTSALAVLIVYRLTQRPHALARYFTLAAILLAAGLLSHYDAALTALPLLVLLGALLWRRTVPWATLLRAMLPGLLVGSALLALFYVPFVIHPHFQATYTYLVNERLVAGQSFPYNNLRDIFQRSVLYSSLPFVVLMISGVTLALVLAYRQGWARRWATVAGMAVVLLVIITCWRVDWLRLGGREYLLLPFGVALGALWVGPRLKLEVRLLWIWFGVAWLLACFFTATARTHIYIFFIPWALLVGDVAAVGWEQMHRRFGLYPAVAIGGIIVFGLIGLIAPHSYRLFVVTEDALRLINRPANKISEPEPNAEIDSLYGFPLANGWKVVGALYAQGVISGPYETNQRYAWIPDWYTRSQHRCASTAEWYFAVDTIEPWAQPKENAEDLVESQGFTRWGEVRVPGSDQPTTKMIIYRYGPATGEPLRIFDLHEFDTLFDASATPFFELNYPIVDDPIRYPRPVNFDGQIWLEGYDLHYTEPLHPGDTFRLTLFWRAQRPIPLPYKVFNQVRDANGGTIAQKDAFSVCDREPTTTWTPGKLITDIHDITLPKDAPASTFGLYTGLYLEETFARLPVLDAAGMPMSDQVQITQLTIQPR
jgi:hypothetical protein